MTTRSERIPESVDREAPRGDVQRFPCNGPTPTLTVDRLAAIIREVDGGHSLGAAALASAILGHPGIADALPRPLPPRPPVEQIESGLVRYGVCWEGIPAHPLLVPMEDGYWTPWHIAAMRCNGMHPQPEQEGA
jgi:hypothetical protein